MGEARLFGGCHQYPYMTPMGYPKPGDTPPLPFQTWWPLFWITWMPLGCPWWFFAAEALERRWRGCQVRHPPAVTRAEILEQGTLFRGLRGPCSGDSGHLDQLKIAGLNLWKIAIGDLPEAPVSRCSKLLRLEWHPCRIHWDWVTLSCRGSVSQNCRQYITKVFLQSLTLWIPWIFLATFAWDPWALAIWGTASAHTDSPSAAPCRSCSRVRLSNKDSPASPLVPGCFFRAHGGHHFSQPRMARFTNQNGCFRPTRPTTETRGVQCRRPLGPLNLSKSHFWKSKLLISNDDSYCITLYYILAGGMYTSSSPAPWMSSSLKLEPGLVPYQRSWRVINSSDAWVTCGYPEQLWL